MSQEQNQYQNFKDSYPLPDDQLSEELTFVENYRQAHPENAKALVHTLMQLNHYGGLGPSVLKVDDNQPGSEEIAAIIAAPPAPETMRAIFVREPYDMESRNISEISDDDYERQSSLSDGRRIYGQPTAAEHDLLEGLYRLTGAEVVRNDERDGEQQGMILRRGYINGRMVFFEENVVQPEASRSGERTMTVEMLGEEWGNRTLVELSQSEKRHLIAAQGIDPFRVIEFMSKHDITRANLHEFLPAEESITEELPVVKSVGQFAAHLATQGREREGAMFERGATLDEAALAFTSKVHDTVQRLSRKFEDLTPAEARLVESAAEMGVVSVRHMLGARLASLPPQDEHFARIAKDVDRELPNGARGRAGFGQDAAVTTDALAMASNDSFYMGNRQEKRAKLEDLAMGIMEMTEAIIRHAASRNRPVEVDPYLAEKLASLQAEYDKLQQQ